MTLFTRTFTGAAVAGLLLIAAEPAIAQTATSAVTSQPQSVVTDVTEPDFS